MQDDDPIPWMELLEGLRNPTSQADPENEDVFALTMLFFEAGLQLADEDLRKGGGQAFGWGPITKPRVVRRTLKLAKARGFDIDGNKLKSGMGAFAQRWKLIIDYRGDLATYAAYSPRWREALESARQELVEGLHDVAEGRRKLSDLILAVAERDMRLRLRFARYVVFQLTLTVDAAYARRVCKAHRVFSERYAQHWVDAYQEALKILGLTLRPDISLKALGTLFSSLALGLAMAAYDNDDDSLTRDDDGTSLLGRGVILMVDSAIDRGDGRAVTAGLDELAR